MASGRRQALSDLWSVAAFRMSLDVCHLNVCFADAPLQPYRPQVLTSAGLCPCCSMYPAQSNI